MQLIELHIIQSFPVSCLNRDDLGAPKTALFGGIPRARISSQCLKRAARVTARELAPSFNGIRTRLLLKPFTTALVECGLNTEEAAEKAVSICEVFSKQDTKKSDQVKTAVYLSPAEILSIAQAVAQGEDPNKAAKKAHRNDAADIALFGRMVANDASLSIEGAAMFSHALSTHHASNDVDYYSAVDDGKEGAADSGAGMIGVLEFTSATYYRYVAINLGLLASEKHLGGVSTEDRKSAIAAFLRATLIAVPSARRNSMNAATLPSEVLGIYKKKGQPIQLVNAFEEPVTLKKDEEADNSEKEERESEKIATQGYRSSKRNSIAAKSVRKLEAELENLKNIWNIEHQEELWLSETKVADFISRLSSYVE